MAYVLYNVVGVDQRMLTFHPNIRQTSFMNQMRFMQRSMNTYYPMTKMKKLSYQKLGDRQPHCASAYGFDGEQEMEVSRSIS